LSQTTQQNAASSEELAATAEEMSGQAEQLQQAMSFFHLANNDGARVLAKVRQGSNRPARRGASLRLADGFALHGDPDEANITKF
jgi:methyl-accepting chemotaxis protein